MSHVQENIVAFHSKLNEFRENEKHCDVTIHVDGKSFKCHRLALSIAGEYFEKMLYGNFRESKEDNVVLQNVSVIAFEEILRFVYTGSISLTVNNIMDVFTASEFFKLDRMQELCVRFIEQKLPMTATTIYELFVFACSCDKKCLMNTLSRCIMEHFEEYYDDIKFPLLELEYENLKLLMSQHWYLCPRNEFMLLNGLLRWLDHEPQNRRKYSEELIDAIDFQFISANCKKSILKRIYSEAEKSDDNIAGVSLIRSSGTNKVNRGVNYGKPELGLHLFLGGYTYSINRCMSEWKKYRSPEQYLIGIGVEDYLYCFDKKLTFQAYSSIDDVAFRSLKSPPAATGGFPLSVELGAIKNYFYFYNVYNSNIWTDPTNNSLSQNGIISRTMCCYNIERDEWFPVPPPDMENEPSTMVASDKVLYFFATGHDSVQMFDGRTSSKWQKFMTNHKNSCYNGCCFHREKLYAYVRDEVECFDPVAQKWSELKYTNDIVFLNKLVSYENWLWGFGVNENWVFGENEESFGIEVYRVRQKDVTS